ncbi:sensor histidine kinase [Buchananella hordeovulneris]|nr:sensor histidine kinase [Buchananella hordeovulneris]RRD50047.1 sensor histidine kinase [Buchananella hordeovulneris]
MPDWDAKPPTSARGESAGPGDTSPTGSPRAVAARHNGRVSAPRPESSVSLRARILWAFVFVMVIALTASGTILWALQARSIHADVTVHLQRVREHLRHVAERGVDPRTNQPFTDPIRVLNAHLRSTVLRPNEGQVAFRDQDLHLIAARSVTLRPEEDPELLEFVKPHLLSSHTHIDTIRTARGHFRILIAPVSYGAKHGALVHVVDLRAATAPLRRAMAFYVSAAALAGAAATGIAALLLGRLLHPIGELRHAAEMIDDKALTERVPVRGRDDLGILARSFNRMLDRVEASVTAQRHLLDDVGHELRTPITIVRGHLELIDAHDPQDVQQTTELAIDELDRMGTLVNDLLLLAKAGEVDFVQAAACRVDELTDQVFEKARALGPRRWHLTELAPVTVHLDASRITQAWLQLAANAVKYSAPDTQIGIGSRLAGGEVLLWVSDQGIGIPAAELERVRERFGRAHGHRPEITGSGLGLSIVETIVTAHGGHLDIVSQVDVGSTFTMCLPLLGPSDPKDSAP